MTAVAATGDCLVCGSADTHLYPCGWRCDTHAPGEPAKLAAELAGRPAPNTGRYCAPWRCYCRECPSWTEMPAYTDDLQWSAVDARAIASGKRRSSPAEYRAAQDEVAAQRARRARRGRP